MAIRPYRATASVVADGLHISLSNSLKKGGLRAGRTADTGLPMMIPPSPTRRGKRIRWEAYRRNSERRCRCSYGQLHGAGSFLDQAEGGVLTLANLRHGTSLSCGLRFRARVRWRRPQP